MRALGRQGFDVFQNARVNHVDAAGGLDDTDVDAPPIGGHGNIVGVAAQRNALGHLQSRAVNYVECAFGFIADIDAAAVGGHRHPVVYLDPLDHADHFICGGIDHINVVTGTIGLDDPDHSISSRARSHRAQNDADENEYSPTKHCACSSSPPNTRVRPEKFAICYGPEYRWSRPTPTLSKFAIRDRFVIRNVCHRCGRNRRQPLRPADGRATDSSSRQASRPAKSPRNSCAIAHRSKWRFPPIAAAIEKLPGRFRPHDKQRNARGQGAWLGRSAVLWF